MRLIRELTNLFNPSMKEKPPKPEVDFRPGKKEIKVIKLAEGSIQLENPEFLAKFPQEIREQFDKLSWLDSAEALRYLAENIASQGDFETAEKIVSQIKDTSIRKDEDHLYWGQMSGQVSLAIAEFNQGLAEKAQQRINVLRQKIDQEKDYDKDGHLTSLARFYIETSQTEQLKEIARAVKSPNDSWRILEPWAELELNQGNHEAALTIEEFVGYDTYKIDLRVMVARKIGHENPQRATEILQGAEEIAERDKQSPDARIDGAWAFIGQPERVREKDDPFKTVELAKHYIVMDDNRAEALLHEAIKRVDSEHLAPEILLEVAEAYLLANDKASAKKYLYEAIQKVADINYTGLYHEEMAYTIDGVYQRIENVLVDIKDTNGLRKVLSVIDETPQHRIQLEIFKLLLDRTKTN